MKNTIRFISLLLVVLMTLPGLCVLAKAPETPDDVILPAVSFEDVTKNDWFYDSVVYCVRNKYFSGVGKNIFSPRSALTREQFMQVLFNFAGENKDDYVTHPTGFTDVPQNQWYSAAIAWAGEKGITSGLGGGKFGLGVQITREQFANLLMNYSSQKGYDVSDRANLSSFTDLSKVSSWALEGVKWAVAVKLIKGTTTTTLSPLNIADRATATMIFMNYDNYLKDLTK